MNYAIMYIVIKHKHKDKQKHNHNAMTLFDNLLNSKGLAVDTVELVIKNNNKTQANSRLRWFVSFKEIAVGDQERPGQFGGFRFSVEFPQDTSSILLILGRTLLLQH